MNVPFCLGATIPGLHLQIVEVITCTALSEKHASLCEYSMHFPAVLSTASKGVYASPEDDAKSFRTYRDKFRGCTLGTF